MTRRTKLADAPTQRGFILLRWRGESLLLRVYVTTRIVSDGPW